VTPRIGSHEEAYLRTYLRTHQTNICLEQFTKFSDQWGLGTQKHRWNNNNKKKSGEYEKHSTLEKRNRYFNKNKYRLTELLKSEQELSRVWR